MDDDEDQLERHILAAQLSSARRDGENDGARWARWLAKRAAALSLSLEDFEARARAEVHRESRGRFDKLDPAVYAAYQRAFFASASVEASKHRRVGGARPAHLRKARSKRGAPPTLPGISNPRRRRRARRMRRNVPGEGKPGPRVLEGVVDAHGREMLLFDAPYEARAKIGPGAKAEGARVIAITDSRGSSYYVGFAIQTEDADGWRWWGPRGYTYRDSAMREGWLDDTLQVDDFAYYDEDEAREVSEEAFPDLDATRFRGLPRAISTPKGGWLALVGTWKGEGVYQGMLAEARETPSGLERLRKAREIARKIGAPHVERIGSAKVDYSTKVVTLPTARVKRTIQGKTYTFEGRGTSVTVPKDEDPMTPQSLLAQKFRGVAQQLNEQAGLARNRKQLDDAVYLSAKAERYQKAAGLALALSEETAQNLLRTTRTAREAGVTKVVDEILDQHARRTARAEAEAAYAQQQQAAAKAEAEAKKRALPKGSQLKLFNPARRGRTLHFRVDVKTEGRARVDAGYRAELARTTREEARRQGRRIIVRGPSGRVLFDAHPNPSAPPCACGPKKKRRNSDGFNAAELEEIRAMAEHVNINTKSQKFIRALDGAAYVLSKGGEASVALYGWKPDPYGGDPVFAASSVGVKQGGRGARGDSIVYPDRFSVALSLGGSPDAPPPRPEDFDYLEGLGIKARKLPGAYERLEAIVSWPVENRHMARGAYALGPYQRGQRAPKRAEAPRVELSYGDLEMLGSFARGLDDRQRWAREGDVDRKWRNKAVQAGLIAKSPAGVWQLMDEGARQLQKPRAQVGYQSVDRAAEERERERARIEAQYIAAELERRRKDEDDEEKRRSAWAAQLAREEAERVERVRQLDDEKKKKADEKKALPKGSQLKLFNPSRRASRRHGAAIIELSRAESRAFSRGDRAIVSRVTRRARELVRETGRPVVVEDAAGVGVLLAKTRGAR